MMSFQQILALWTTFNIFGFIYRDVERIRSEDVEPKMIRQKKNKWNNTCNREAVKQFQQLIKS